MGARWRTMSLPQFMFPREALMSKMQTTNSRYLGSSHPVNELKRASSLMSSEGDEKVVSQEADRALADLAIESWRFQKLFARVLGKLDAGDAMRFVNQHRYFIKRIDEC